MANFVNETDVDNKLFTFNKRINSNKTKYELNFVFNKKYWKWIKYAIKKKLKQY